MDAPHLLYESPLLDATGQSICRVHGPAGSEVLHFPGLARFAVTEDGITRHLELGACRLEADLMAAGPVLAFEHERAGRPVLHGACLAPGTSDAPAFALLGVKEAGKSTLAAACLAQGAVLLGDDLVPLDLAPGSSAPPRVLSIAPRIRLWPAALGRVLGLDATDPATSDELARFELVHPSTTKRWVPVGGGEGAFGRFDGRPRPLGGIYLLDRRDDVDTVSFETLAPSQAVIELVRHSFLGRMVEALGWQPRRLGLLAQVASAVPVRRFVFPQGFEHLDDAVAALLFSPSRI